MRYLKYKIYYFEKVSKVWFIDPSLMYLKVPKNRKDGKELFNILGDEIHQYFY